MNLIVRATVEKLAPRPLLVFRGPPGAQGVALTFDDGPEPHLDEYLDVLDCHRAPATFFLLGKSCAARRDQMLEIVRRGHEVASHGWSHKRFPLMTRAELDDELRRTAELLPEPLRARPLVRPPQGATSVRSLARCAVNGYTTVLWSLDSDDCRTEDPRRVVETVVSRVRPGDIVLLHEGQRWTLEALPELLSALEGAGHPLVTVSSLLAG